MVVIIFCFFVGKRSRFENQRHGKLFSQRTLMVLFHLFSATSQDKGARLIFQS